MLRERDGLRERRGWLREREMLRCVCERERERARTSSLEHSKSRYMMAWTALAMEAVGTPSFSAHATPKPRLIRPGQPSCPS